MSTETEMTIRAIAPWFGGKRTLAPVIVEELMTQPTEKREMRKGGRA